MGSRRRKSRRQKLEAANVVERPQQTDPAETAKGPDSQLADDFMFGWNTENEVDKEAFGLAIAHGQMDPDALAEFRSLSLLRGFEELDMTLACASSLLRKDADPESLDGQDILTYVARLLGNLSQEPVLSSRQLEPWSVQQDKSTTFEGESKNRKRKRGEDSPYFAEHEIPESVARKIAKKARKQAKKQTRRSLFAEQLEPDAASLAVQHNPTVLQDAATWYLGSRNDKHEDAAHDGDDVQNGIRGKSHSTNRTAEGHDGLEDCPDVARAEPINAYEIQSEEFDTAVDSQSPLLETCAGVASMVNGGESIECASLQSTLVGSKRPSDTDEPPRRVLRPSNCTPKRTTSSKFFESLPKATSPAKTKSPRPPRGTVSALPFPTLSAPRFGLVQEELAGDPFRLLIAVTFLVRTSGKAAVPVFRTLMDKFPSPEALAGAQPSEISAMIKHLGLSVVRTAQIQKFARIWLEKPPTRDVRYGVKNYPRTGDGSDIWAGEELPPEEHDDSRTSAWEIGHMTQGPYAIDSWRIFCRDALLERAQDWKGKGREGEFQPEWMRVLPQDKELRAYLRWMWMLEGWAWDPATGDKEVLSEQLWSAVNEGRVAWDNTGNLNILEKQEEADDGNEKA
ncbi:methyl-CpG-binding domain-containing protein 4 [Apiospora phragmitis]|uniref:Methyl-CpG-binding domain-containing protein 4 n=1 Tax=Apiospora phragmitis TaxID=2905665 RepID=A0ABR1TSB1_9PEZI